MSKRLIKTSRFLSLVLRHRPELLGLTLDQEGWVSVAELIRRTGEAGRPLTEDELAWIVENDEKRRYSFSEDRSRIRANYGHSLEVELDSAARRPPDVLFHGTATSSLGSILSQGIVPGRRQYVHLSSDPETALMVGQRHGTPVVLRVAAAEMHEKGCSFFETGTGIWLTARVPAEFIEPPESQADTTRGSTLHRIRIVRDDITALEVDVVVNAANERMLGGGGVDGAIHAAAGPELVRACRAVPEVRPGVRCPTGEARITPAFALPARWVVHTVGPVWRGGCAGEPELLASCYSGALSLAAEHGATSIAFPAISCGVFGYPIERAAEIAVRESAAFLARRPDFEAVLLVAFQDEVANSLRRALDG